MERKWSKEAIGLEIAGIYESGESLTYSNMAAMNLNLLRAATRYFGTWEAAVMFAGFDYGSIRRYKLWSREQIIVHIWELHEQGADLSWGNVSLTHRSAACRRRESHRLPGHAKENPERIAV